MKRTWDWRDGRFAQVGLSALTLLFGMQTLRTLLPLLLYVLRDRIGWNAIQIGLLAFAIFLTSFLASRLRHWWGRRPFLRITVGGFGLLRLAYQVWQGDPLIDLYLVAAAAIMFILSVPACLGYIRSGGPKTTGALALGALLGLTVDTAFHGLYVTYDMSWRADWGTAVAVFLLVAVQWLLLGQLLAERVDNRPSANDVSIKLALALLAFGPFLFLQMLVFQNMARLAALTGWAYPLAFGWVLLAQLLGLGTAVFLYACRHPKLWVGALILGALLFASLLIGWPRGWLAAIFLLAGQIAAFGLMMLVMMGLGAGNGHAGLSRITIAYGLSAVLMVLLTFLFYVGYDLPLPFPNTIVPPIAALIMAVAGVGATRRLMEAKTKLTRPWQLGLAFLLLLPPLAQFLLWEEVTAVPGDGAPVRVMTYNLHNGFDPNGHLELEAIAQVIEAQSPDIIALQEVSRGWVMNGSLDMLAWLSQRLDMPYLYGSTSDPLWGNAVLSRYPIIESELVALPPDDLPLKRGFIWAKVDVGDGERLNIIATHYHHPDDGGAVRVAQSETILDYWKGDGRTVIMGDLNAEPGAPEIELLRQAGFADALDLAAVQPGYTYPATAPAKRIDYIWLSPDLAVSQVVIPPDPVSDHLGIAAAIGQ
ncbi:MAG: hypothetical protein GY803_21175 [Chloroflexi bacterium]|nr:hypothetical protein [Chloroflexota bacterium]